MEELKPCPFCGGKAEYNNSDTCNSQWYECTECGAIGPRSFVGSNPEDKWNTRVQENNRSSEGK